MSARAEVGAGARRASKASGWFDLERAVASTRVACAIAAAVFLFAGDSAAQFSMVDDAPPRFEWRGRVEADFRNQFEAKTDRGDEFDRWETGLAGEFGGPVNESILMGFRAAYRHSSFDFNLDKAAPGAYGTRSLPRDPWNSINVVDLGPTATVLVGSQVSIAASVPIRWAGESGSDRNGFSAGISAIVRWQAADNFSIGAGIGFTSQLEDSIETFPLVTMNWKIDETLSLATEGSWIQGGRTRLLWGATETIRLSVSAGYERTRFRLDNNGNAPDRNGIGELTQIPVEVGVRLQFMPEFFLDVRAGVAFGGRLRVETDSGRKLFDRAYDPAPTLGAKITIPFGLSPSTQSVDPAYDPYAP